MSPRQRIAWQPAAWVGLALVAALAPRPAWFVERVYGQGVYPPLQRTLTWASNLSPWALLDVLLAGALVATIRWSWRGVVASRATGQLWPLAGALMRVVSLGAAAYIWFLAVWGLNYARPPIDVRLALAPGVATGAEVDALAQQAVAEANAGYLAARAGASADDQRALVQALHLVERRHGRVGPTEVGRPKPSLLRWYFRAAGVDGLTAPFFLETILHPDLTEAEQPFVLAHEWAHLSGYAPEADANFVAWLTTMASNAPRHRYSGWLFLVGEAARQLPGPRQRVVLSELAAGPRRDLAEIARRASQRIDLVERVGWRVYDGYLRAQGVEDGIRSYSRVIELIVRAQRPGRREDSAR